MTTPKDDEPEIIEDTIPPGTEGDVEATGEDARPVTSLTEIISLRAQNRQLLTELERVKQARLSSGGTPQDEVVDWDGLVNGAETGPYRALAEKIEARQTHRDIINRSRADRELALVLFPDFDAVMTASGMWEQIQTDVDTQNTIAQYWHPAIAAYQMARERQEAAKETPEGQRETKGNLRSLVDRKPAAPPVRLPSHSGARIGGSGPSPRKELTQAAALELPTQDWEKLDAAKKQALLGG
jgi:hypothetical protein